MARGSEAYQYLKLPTLTSFRILELLPGHEGDDLSCLLHSADWSNARDYEAISYAWGDPSIRESITCHEGELKVTRNLHMGLTHLRLEDRSRFLWVDAIW